MIYQDLINNTIKGEDALLHYIDNWNTGTASDAAKAAWQRAARGVYSRSGAVRRILDGLVFLIAVVGSLYFSVVIASIFAC